jgi:predicted CXXCH cytochrome family protein
MRKRRSAAVAFAVLAVAFCLYVFGGSSPSSLMSPGDVTFQHSSPKQDCVQCHLAAEGNFSNWVTHAFDSQIALADSARCLKCHPEIEPNALSPHGMASSQLAAISERIEQSPHSVTRPLSLSVAALMGNANMPGDLACATCHHEHRGKQFDLTRMSDLACQSCHARQFESFAQGHPELIDYPYNRRTRIYFDHAKHLLQYFVDDEFKRLSPDGMAPETCTSCHQPDGSGDFMLTAGFEPMCAGCHADQIADKGFPGIRFFALPDFRATAADDDGADAKLLSIGEWPSRPSESQMNSLPSFMELLLASDPRYQAAESELGNLAPQRLTQARQEHAKAVEEYLWSIKYLLHDVVQNGESALARRLGSEYAELVPKTSSIHASLVTVQRLWFPNLAADIQARRDGTLSSQTSGSEMDRKRFALRGAEQMSVGGWAVLDADYSVRYRPVGHADALLKAWLEQSVSTGTAAGDADDPQQLVLAEMFHVLESPSASGGASTNELVASGRCLQCHTADRDPDSGNVRINWTTFRPAARPDGLTRFSHAPHVQKFTQNECTACHQLKPGTSPGDAFFRRGFFERDSHRRWRVNTDPCGGLTTDFSPIRKSNCSECHNATAVRQSCLTCHNYHGSAND